MDVRKNCVVVDTFNKTDEECMEAEIDHEYNCTFLSKKATKGIGEFIGMSRIQADSVENVCNCLERCDPKNYYEDGYNIGIKEKSLQFTVLDTFAEVYFEVDNWDDYLKSKEIFENQ